MAFYYDQLQEIFDLKDGNSVVLDQKNGEALLVKLANNGFDHTFLLVDNYVMGETQINFDDLNIEGFNNGNFVVGVVNDTVVTDLAKFLFHFCKDTAINILKNLTNPTPVTITDQQRKILVERFAPIAIYASEIQKRN